MPLVTESVEWKYMPITSQHVCLQSSRQKCCIHTMLQGVAHQCISLEGSEQFLPKGRKLCSWQFITHNMTMHISCSELFFFGRHNCLFFREVRLWTIYWAIGESCLLVTDPALACLQYAYTISVNVTRQKLPMIWQDI